MQTLESRVRQLQMHAEEKEMSTYLHNQQMPQMPTMPHVYLPPRYVAPQHNPAYNVLLRKDAWPDVNKLVLVFLITSVAAGHNLSCWRCW